MEPSEKSPELEKWLEKNFGRTTAITSNKCVTKPIGCGRDIPPSEIESWSPLQQREYTISGLCNTCQNEVFGTESDPE